MTSTREGRRRRPLLISAFVNVGLGILFLAIGLNQPSIANVRPVVLVNLFAAGACLGMGLMTLVLFFVLRRHG
jgi:hypothetical protein